MIPAATKSSLGFFAALILSLSIHMAMLLEWPHRPSSPRPPSSSIAATLRPPPVLPPTPELHLEVPPPVPTPTAAPAPPSRVAKPPAPSRLAVKPRAETSASLGTLPAPAAVEARKQLARLAAQEDFYPQEAILQGWEGEALVQIFLDEQGKVVAARIETSSGHKILDDAALKATRALHSLATGGVGEALLPVRFRLQ